MAIRLCFIVYLGLLATSLGCAGMSGQRFYEEPEGAARGLGDIVDCPTCPRGERGSVVHAPPTALHDDGVISPHAKFHPLPTRPVFAPKVVPASTTLASTPAAPAPTPALVIAPESESATQASIDVAVDEAPSPPVAAVVAAKTSSRSVLKRNPIMLSPDNAKASVLVASQAVPQVKIEHAEVKPATASVAYPEAVAPRATSDGWRPRVAH